MKLTAKFYQDSTASTVLEISTIQEPTIADVVKSVCFVNTASPNSDHILVPIDQELQPGAVPLCRYPTSQPKSATGQTNEEPLTS